METETWSTEKVQGPADSLYVGSILPVSISKYTVQGPPTVMQPTFSHGATILSSIFPKTILDLKSVKYLPLATLASYTQAAHATEPKENLTEVVFGKEIKKRKREIDAEEERYVKVYAPEWTGTGREKSPPRTQYPTWTNPQYNRRPLINTPWMKDTQGAAFNTMHTINGAMLELSDIDVQKETARANLVLVQKMAELVAAEKDKVKAEMEKIEAEVERLEADRERAVMDTHKLEMEKEMFEAKIISGTARSAQH